ncbi:virulence factor TspB C-terminal domain-related protein [Xanthomonas campestris]|uniref:virulence factor TspB C-terminal domain-related protein n=1 Tax=Xanthomonas campestris TaxID=339 RepID=UPI003D18AAA4
MRWLARVFASAIVRRCAYLLVALIAAWCGVGRAEAKDYEDQGAAYSGCMSDARGSTAALGGKSQGSCALETEGLYKCYAYQLWNGNQEVLTLCGAAPGFETSHRYVLSCASKPSAITQFQPMNGSSQCWNGCEVKYRQNGDDETSTRSTTGAVCDPDYKKKCPVGSFWNGYMGVCQPIDPSCPEGQVKQDGVCKPENKCPQGMVAVQASTPGAVAQGALYCAPEKEECPPGTIMSPAGKCLPGEGQCAKGEAPGKDGTCKKDADGDGEGDEEGDGEGEGGEGKKDEASGGESCETPPSCSGSAIQCIQVKIQWRIDCNTRRSQNISGGTCDAVPVCTGKACDAMEYAQLMQQWRSTCVLEKLAKATNASGNSTDKNGNGVADALEGSGAVTEPGDGKTDVDGAKRFGIRFSADKLDTENIFGGGSCPEPPSFTIMGKTISGGDFPYFCRAAAILRALVLMFGAYLAVKILMGWMG